jgi:hypothetical protein
MRDLRGGAFRAIFRRLKGLPPRVFLPAALLLVPLLMGPIGAARAEVVDPDHGVRLRLAAPIHNLTEYKVWRSRFDPTDALPEKMTQYFLDRLKNSPLVTATLIDKGDNAGWSTEGMDQGDAVIKINLERADFFRRDTFGTKTQGNVFVRMTVYEGLSRREIFVSTANEKVSRWTPDYQDTLDGGPVLWKDFERSAYWGAVKKGLDALFRDMAEHYTGYRIVGRIAAQVDPLVRYDSPFSLGHARRKYAITLGRNDSLRLGDVLAVVKSEAIRTEDPENPVILFPQVYAKVRVIFLKAHDAVVELEDKAKGVPLEVGDLVMTPAYGPRDAAMFLK